VVGVAFGLSFLFVFKSSSGLASIFVLRVGFVFCFCCVRGHIRGGCREYGNSRKSGCLAVNMNLLGACEGTGREQGGDYLVSRPPSLLCAGTIVTPARVSNFLKDDSLCASVDHRLVCQPSPFGECDALRISSHGQLVGGDSWCEPVSKWFCSSIMSSVCRLATVIFFGSSERSVSGG